MHQHAPQIVKKFSVRLTAYLPRFVKVRVEMVTAATVLSSRRCSFVRIGAGASRRRGFAFLKPAFRSMADERGEETMNGSRSNSPRPGAQPYGDRSSLDALNRTIEGLEARIEGSDGNGARDPRGRVPAGARRAAAAVPDPIAEIMQRQRTLTATRERDVVANASSAHPERQPGTARLRRASVLHQAPVQPARDRRSPPFSESCAASLSQRAVPPEPRRQEPVRPAPDASSRADLRSEPCAPNNTAASRSARIRPWPRSPRRWSVCARN